jgi:hypothetical protein
MYDVACLFVTVFVSYYGGQQSKSRWLGWALFILGIANFVFILPHFLIGKYEAGMYIENILLGVSQCLSPMRPGF